MLCDINRKTTIALTAAVSIFTGSQVLADAVLLDGTVLTPTAEVFATEGPIWNIDPASQQITVVGKTLTIADTIDGVQLFIFGSSVLGQDGEAATGISAASFDRLSDVHATTGGAGGGVNEERCGPARSLFSTSEARRTDAPPGLHRFPLTQAQIEANYFAMVRAAANDPAHAGSLPVDFLQNSGIDRPDGSGGIRDVYPVTAGGTLKSAGHVYTDGIDQYFITDIETVLELSENVSGGPIKTASPGVHATLDGNGLCNPGFVPPSFVIGDLLVIFNQDPRFGAEVLGLGEAEIPRDVFFDQLATQPNIAIDIIGHLVGEHVMFVQEVLTDFIDPNAGVIITVDRLTFVDNAGRIRFIGVVTLPADLSVIARLTDGTNVITSFPITLIVDPLTGGATYTVDERDIVNLAAVTDVIIEATNTVTGEVTSVTAFRNGFNGDDDGDGVVNGLDLCPNTPPGATVDGDGCSPSQLDSDGDGVNDDLDNCTLVANADQRDTNGDGFGNICDADLNGDLLTDLSDFSVFRSAFGTADPDADLNGDGVVDLSDFSLFRGLFGSAPGPSGL